MASPETIDFERLLAPISEDQPAGAELKDDSAHSGAYYQAKDAREAARAAERAWAQYHPEDDSTAQPPDSPDWAAVVELTTDILATRSKDLWIASWLIEGLAREKGFAGLRDGFRLTRELCERYWDGIHPRPDEDGVLTTVAQLAGLNGDESEGALLGPIDAIPITAGTTMGPYSSYQYLQALELEKLDPTRRSQRVEQGAVSLEMFQKSVHESPPEFFRNLRADIDAALDEFQKLSAVLDEKCGNDASGYAAAPPTSAIRQALEACRQRLIGIRGDESTEAEQGAGGAAGALVAAGGAAGTSVAAAGGKVVTREDAFRLLLQVAEFFRRSEPHSPVSYALEQAVRWGRMSLPDLMSDLIGDAATRDDFFRRVGIAKPTDGSSG